MSVSLPQFCRPKHSKWENTPKESQKSTARKTLSPVSHRSRTHPLSRPPNSPSSAPALVRVRPSQRPDRWAAPPPWLCPRARREKSRTRLSTSRRPAEMCPKYALVLSMPDTVPHCLNDYHYGTMSLTKRQSLGLTSTTIQSPTHFTNKRLNQSMSHSLNGWFTHSNPMLSRSRSRSRNQLSPTPRVT